MKKNLLLLFFVFTSLNIFPQCWTNISAGGAHTIALRDGGTLWTWGRNNNGQLGIGSSGSTIYNTPQQVGTQTNWSKISAGNSHCLALKNDNTLWAWGRNSDGQVGVDSNSSMFVSPQQIGTDNDWLMISAGDEYSFAIKTNGTLWAWGDNINGQLGDNSTEDRDAPVQIGTDNDWNWISAGTSHTLAIKKNGTLWAWGSNSDFKFGANTPANSPIPIQIGTDSNWKIVRAARDHSIGLKTGSSNLWVWGGNTSGQLADNTNVGKDTPTEITSLGIIKTIAKGHQNTFFIKESDNTLWSSGGNSSGQLGNGNNDPKNFAVNEFSTSNNWLMVDSKVSHTVAIKSDGTLYTWGANLFGQLGEGSQSPKNKPVLITCPTLSNDGNFTVEKISVYPNPASDIVNLPINFNSASNLTITDIGGKKIYFTLQSNKSITITHLTKGIYFLSFEENGQVYQTKFVKI
jgi:alpha-tubulin suppressor-like RCC1 family protein